jgi:hypothetical protein
MRVAKSLDKQLGELDALVSQTGLLVVARRESECLDAIHERISLAPDDPLPWSSLSGWHFYGHGFYDADQPTLHAALEAIDKAVAKARVKGAWLRQCLNDRARIVVGLKRWDLLAETLRAILAIESRRGVPDIRLEDDFLQRVPEDAINSDLLAEYRSAVAAQNSVR